MFKMHRRPPRTLSPTAGLQPVRFTLPSLRASESSGSAVYGSKNTKGSFLFLRAAQTLSLIFLATLILGPRPFKTRKNLPAQINLSKQDPAQKEKLNWDLFNCIQHLQMSSYLWVVPRCWLQRRFWPWDRSGECWTSRLPTSSSYFLWFQRQKCT